MYIASILVNQSFNFLSVVVIHGASHTKHWIGLKHLKLFTLEEFHALTGKIIWASC